MSMSRAERFQLRFAIVETLEEWNWNRTNLLFAEFGLPTLDDDRFSPSLTDIVSQLSQDDLLVEMYAVVKEIPVEEARADAESLPEDAAAWKPGYTRLFISHSAVHREAVSAVSEQLAVLGIDGFVAHQTMEVNRPWQAQIERALRTMEAFVLLAHPEVGGSAWCHQEVGWALGRRVPFFAVRIGADPIGFPSHLQWPSGEGQSPKAVAGTISEWITGLPGLGDVMVDRLFEALARAGNYFDAEAVAARVASLGALTDEQFERLAHIWWANDQLHGGVLPTNKMRPFFEQQGRAWPPPKPSPPSPPRNDIDEEPF